MNIVAIVDDKVRQQCSKYSCNTYTCVERRLKEFGIDSKHEDKPIFMFETGAVIKNLTGFSFCKKCYHGVHLWV